MKVLSNKEKKQKLALIQTTERIKNSFREHHGNLASEKAKLEQTFEPITKPLQQLLLNTNNNKKNINHNINTKQKTDDLMSVDDYENNNDGANDFEWMDFDNATDEMPEQEIKSTAGVKLKKKTLNKQPHKRKKHSVNEAHIHKENQSKLQKLLLDAYYDRKRKEMFKRNLVKKPKLPVHILSTFPQLLKLRPETITQTVPSVKTGKRSGKEQQLYYTTTDSVKPFKKRFKEDEIQKAREEAKVRESIERKSNELQTAVDIRSEGQVRKNAKSDKAKEIEIMKELQEILDVEGPSPLDPIPSTSQGHTMKTTDKRSRKEISSPEKETTEKRPKKGQLVKQWTHHKNNHTLSTDERPSGLVDQDIAMNSDAEETTGKGLQIPFVPYMKKTKTSFTYWDDPNELVDRLRLLLASQAAGHTNHTNEIRSILDELKEAHIIT